MLSPDKKNKIYTAIALAAEICCKPFKYSVVCQEDNHKEIDTFELNDDLILILECRDIEGKRIFDKDIELEIYKSGDDFNIMINWVLTKDELVLWYGSHPVWINAQTGQRLSPANNTSTLESLARRIRAIFVPLD